jgi:hypothetical protein
VIRAVTGRPVAMAIEPLIARQQAVERGQQVLVRAGAYLDDDQARGRVRDEDRQESVPTRGRVAREPCAVGGQVDEPATATGPDRQLLRLYGKMFRIASRSRPIPPPAGADS